MEPASAKQADAGNKVTISGAKFARTEFLALIVISSAKRSDYTMLIVLIHDSNDPSIL